MAKVIDTVRTGDTVRTIDMDSHLYEFRGLWEQYIDPGHRDLAMQIVDDELGYAMLTCRGASPPRGAYCFVTEPRVRRPDDPLSLRNLDPAGNEQEDGNIGGPQRARRAGIRATSSYDEMPRTYWNPAARLSALDGWGVDEAILFPQWGLEFETMFFEHDLEAHRANLAAWNRWVREATSDGGGRLHPVGHLTLQGDHRWLTEQLEFLAGAGCTIAYFTPGLINGKRMSHPDNDPIWQAFVDNGVTATFHINVGAPRLLDAAWTDNDHIIFSALGMWAIQLPAQLALADMAFNGVFERFPDLRILVAEHSPSTWVDAYLQRLDAIYLHQPRLAGWHAQELAALPSEYVTGNCRFSVLPTENVAGMTDQVRGVLGFSGDYPHDEGVADPLGEFQRLTGVDRRDPASELLYRENAEWVLYRG